MNHQVTVAVVKDMRLDVLGVEIADGLKSLADERYLFEQACVRQVGGNWSVGGAQSYRILCAAEALVRALIKGAKAEAGATGKTPETARQAVEAARREFMVCLEGVKDAVVAG